MRGGFEKEDGERRFDDALHPLVLRGVFASGLEKPSDGQVPLLEALGRRESCLVKGRAGTGKTTAAVIAFLDDLARWDSEKEEARVFHLCWKRRESAVGVLIRDVVGVISKAVFDRRRRPRMLYVVPTRELVNAVNVTCNTLAAFMKFRSVTFIAGRPVQDQKFDMATTDALIGTPGRLLDCAYRKWTDLSKFTYVVLDEGNDLIDRGFGEQLQDLLAALDRPQLCAVHSVSAPKLDDLVKDFGPRRVPCSARRFGFYSDNVPQLYIAVEREEWKRETLVDLVDCLSDSRIVVYCNSPERAELVRENLTAAGVGCVRDMTEADRVLFDNRTVRVMIRTDEVPRGGYPGAFVVHYDLNMEPKVYVSRIGSKEGDDAKSVSVIFVKEEEVPALRELERYLRSHIGEMSADVSFYIDWMKSVVRRE